MFNFKTHFLVHIFKTTLLSKTNFPNYRGILQINHSWAFDWLGSHWCPRDVIIDSPSSVNSPKTLHVAFCVITNRRWGEVRIIKGGWTDESRRRRRRFKTSSAQSIIVRGSWRIIFCERYVKGDLWKLHEKARPENFRLFRDDYGERVGGYGGTTRGVLRNITEILLFSTPSTLTVFFFSPSTCFTPFLLACRFFLGSGPVRIQHHRCCYPRSRRPLFLLLPIRFYGRHAITFGP